MSADEPRTETTPEEPGNGEGAAPAARPAARTPPNPLSRPTDVVARPGFRNPPNRRSKAQKKAKKRKKRR